MKRLQKKRLQKKLRESLNLKALVTGWLHAKVRINQGTASKWMVIRLVLNKCPTITKAC
jgi:hypothetical protein